MTIISYLNKLANFSKYRSSCLSSKDLGSVRANWIWISANLQWSLETQSLFPHPPWLSPLVQGYFRYAVGYPLSRGVTWKHTFPRFQHRDFMKTNGRTHPRASTSNSLSLSPFSPLSLSSSLSSLVCTVHVDSNSR